MKSWQSILIGIVVIIILVLIVLLFVW